jgi:hypothetical protein
MEVIDAGMNEPIVCFLESNLKYETKAINDYIRANIFKKSVPGSYWKEQRESLRQVRNEDRFLWHLLMDNYQEMEDAMFQEWLASMGHNGVFVARKEIFS